MPSAKPPPRKPARTADRDEKTDPGVAPQELEGAQSDAAPDEAPVVPGPGDATLVYDKNKGRPRGGGEFRLVAVAGPKKGSEFTLADDRTTIGRGSDNVLVIPDISVSRQHVLVERAGERWVVVDQGSGNGTKVNGRPVTRYPLQHGDEIAMGDTTLQFVEPGGVVVKGGQRQAVKSLADEAAVERTGAGGPRPSAVKKRLPLYAAVLGALLIAFGAGVVRKQKQDRAREEARQGDESTELAQQRFGEGVALLKQGKWAEARDRLKLAAELDSGRDPEIARFLERAEAEAPRAQNLAAARAALARKDYAAARSALSAIPEDSALAEGAHDLEQQIRTALDAAVRDARARAEAGDTSAASEVLEPVLAAEPTRADALAVKEVIGSPKRASPAPRRERAPADKPAGAASGADTADVLDAYLAGDIGLALEKAQLNARAPRLLAQLQQFDSAYKDGLAKVQAHKVHEALKALETAAGADKAIAQGRDSRLGREVRKSLAQLHYQLGIASVGTDEGLPQAATHLRAAVAADPSNDLAQQQLSQVIARAKELYLQGYVEKDNDAQAARRAFKIVGETLPSTDETAVKARRWLDKLDGKAPPREDG